MGRQLEKVQEVMPNDLNIEKGKPLILPSGTTVEKDESGRVKVETKKQREDAAFMDELLSDPFMDEEVETFQRTLADINVPVAQFNPVMLVLSYSMWGLDNNSIGRYLNITEDQVASIVGSDLFIETRKQILEAIRYAEASSIHGYLSQKAKKAATVIANSMSSRKEDISMAAAKDILDRAGYRPVDKVEHSHKFDDELRIVHLQEAKTVDIDIGV